MLKKARTSSSSGEGREGGEGGGGPAVTGDSAVLIPEEYEKLGMLAGQFFNTLRVSIGDNSLLKQTIGLTIAENSLFWSIWVLAVIITNVIFLNFIVAEASASYTKVTETLVAVIWQERASMIHEAERMTRKKKKTKE
jgi:hypothetical protein